MLDLSDQIVADIMQFLNRPMRRRLRRDRQQPIVALSSAVLGLLRFDDTYKPRRHDASGKHRRIHQDQQVKRIAVLPK